MTSQNGRKEPLLANSGLNFISSRLESKNPAVPVPV